MTTPEKAPGERTRGLYRYVSGATVPARPAFRIGPISTVWRPRQFFTTLGMVIALAVLAAVSLGLGDYPISPLRVAEIILTNGGTRIEHLVVFDWRMPRTLTAVLVGSALGISGALTQSVTRNALASPDILGITTGASAAAVTVIVLGGGSTGLVGWLSDVGIPIASLLGAILTGAVIWALAYRRGVDPFRLVLAGIVISSLLAAYINFLMTRANLDDAASAQMWLAGSLNTADWSSVRPVLAIVVLLTPLFVWITFQLFANVLGPDVARGLGQNVTVVQALLLILSVILAAMAVAAAGPIGFVAFVSPQIARLICGRDTPPIVASGLFGALLLLAADIVTQTWLPMELPVGLLTSAVGGLFLIYLLITTNRKTTTS
ncbi:FecCD family ABC transporter permease [Corynebacterium terpenotabidum]|uniref:Iron ABC transport system permease n=1 Tax=Corynebacterium terpenotabidum Y-11 TaxID=1200352 RepID=S4XEK8_9CORY|nr:iron chelate uptake ABC transporter family permease subunit [Corynebacterium terpenotabidum]AGP31582.1 iron ABC transport system permease [Corynebacterium terpenotabidum Y-11]